MKNTSILFLFLFILLTDGYSQAGQMTKQDVPIIKKSQTYFVLDDEDSTLYNKSMVKYAKSFWKITEVNFIKYSQLQEYIQKPNLTFVLKLIFAVNTNSGVGDWSYNFNPKTNSFDKTYKALSPGLKYRYDAIVLVSGGKKKPVFQWKDWLSFSLVDDINDDIKYHYKIGSYLQIIQNYISFIENGNEDKGSLSKDKEYYNINKGNLKNKTLYINASELPEGINSIDKIKEVYKYDVKLVSETEIKTAIENQDPKIVILNNVYTANRYYPYFFEAKEGKVIYLDMDRNYIINPAKTIKKILTEACSE